MVSVDGGYSVRRVPLAYEHPKMKDPNSESNDVFIPLKDGCEYWDIIDSQDEYRSSIAQMRGDAWESLHNAFFGEPHQKFRDELSVGGVSVKPDNPKHLSELVLANIDDAPPLDFNDYTPVPLSTPDEDGFGYAVYLDIEWGTSNAIPVSRIFSSQQDLEDYTIWKNTLTLFPNK